MHYNSGPNMAGNYFRDSTQTSGAPGSTLMGEFMTAITKEFETILNKSGDSFYSDYGTDQFNQLAKTIFESSVIGNAAMADDAIDTAQLVNGAVTTAKIEDSSISAAKIQSTAVTQSKIEDGAVVLSKLDNTTTIAKLVSKYEPGNITTNGAITTLTWAHGLAAGTLVRLSLRAKLTSASGARAKVSVFQNTAEYAKLAIQGTQTEIYELGTSAIATALSGQSFTVVADLTGGSELDEIGIVYETLPMAELV